ncbi:MAG: hypothetical protein Q8N99_00925 [Nanoarchaeota archaeon]|nr:hypothetical protein [Nanoarchaeota archaeon]
MELKKLLKKALESAKPEAEIMKKINKVSSELIIELKNKIRQKKILAQVFVGGSLAKNTLVKTDDNIYDVDIFVRFNEKYHQKNDAPSHSKVCDLNGARFLAARESPHSKECDFQDSRHETMSEILCDIVSNHAFKIHGSRDYYQLKKDNIILEIIPVLKINKPEKAKNVTDLSYFHVNYVLEKIKKRPRLADEIILAKAFIHSQNAYGAESYIHGFSGYSVELLILHYESFLKFIKAIAESKEDKIIIDDKKFFKNKNEVKRELNEAKLFSPIILIDPTNKERNALSGLSKEIFDKFKLSCQEFLKKPKSSFFKKKNVSDKFKNYSNLRVVSIKTNKQIGDISGSKSKKFYDFFILNLKKDFIIKKSGFNYDENENLAKFYLVLDKKEDDLIKGPPIERIDNLTAFRKAHPDSYIKDGIAYAKLSHDFSFEEYIKNFIKKQDKILDEMSIEDIKLEK